jgi:hypothetical protein
VACDLDASFCLLSAANAQAKAPVSAGAFCCCFWLFAAAFIVAVRVKLLCHVAEVYFHGANDLLCCTYRDHSFLEWAFGA